MSKQGLYPAETLELNKVLLMLAKKTACKVAYEKALRLKPQSNILKVNRLLSETHSAYDLEGRFGSPSFGGLYDIRETLHLAKSGRVLTNRELLDILSVLQTFSGIANWKKQCLDVQTDIDYLFLNIYTNNFLQKKISDSILSEDDISDSASSELFSIRRKIRNISSNIRDKLERIVKSPSSAKYLQDPIVTIRDNRFVIPVKSECRGMINGLIHDVSSSGSTIFTEPMAVVELNNEINLLRASEENEINKILKNLSQNVAECCENILNSYKTAVKLNIIFAKADLAYEMRATMPIMNDENIIDLKKARHPLIDAKKVVPIDVNLGKDFDTLIITGPNTGGKTVTLKTIGLLTLMSMCGFMIPADDNSELCVFKKIFCDIGDEQSIEQSLSTFSAHMTNIVKIQKNADKNSLILLDELGAGTDPVEGAALAMAVLENLRDKGSDIVATTHYAELKAFALNTGNVENACCEFDIKTLQPTYKLVIGIPGKSNAFAISQKLSMPESIIKRANELISYENKTFENVIESLEKTRAKLEKERSRVQKLSNEIKVKKAQNDEYERKIKRTQEKIIDEAKRKAQKIIFSAQKNAEELLYQIDKVKKENRKDRDISKLRRDLGKAQKQADPVVQKSNSGYTLPRKIQIGDNVLIVDLDREAEVLKLPDQNGDVLVQAGILQTRVSLKNLRLIASKSADSGVISKGKLTTNVEKSSKMQIDLRGMTVFEALGELDKFIDQVAYSGIRSVTIIHGKGTGVLRQEVGNFLKRNKTVESYRLGAFGEGDSGVTIAQLKIVPNRL